MDDQQFLQSRRAFTTFATLGLVGGIPVAAPSANAATTPTSTPTSNGAFDAVKAYPAFQARADGKPAFWFSRDREYAFIGGEFKFLADRRLIQAARVFSTVVAATSRRIANTRTPPHRVPKIRDRIRVIRGH